MHYFMITVYTISVRVHSNFFAHLVLVPSSMFTEVFAVLACTREEMYCTMYVHVLGSGNA
jgi:hypothetical protein